MGAVREVDVDAEGAGHCERDRSIRAGNAAPGEARERKHGSRDREHGGTENGVGHGSGFQGRRVTTTFPSTSGRRWLSCTSPACFTCSGVGPVPSEIVNTARRSRSSRRRACPPSESAAAPASTAPKLPLAARCSSGPGSAAMPASESIRAQVPDEAGRRSGRLVRAEERQLAALERARPPSGAQHRGDLVRAQVPQRPARLDPEEPEAHRPAALLRQRPEQERERALPLACPRRRRGLSARAQEEALALAGHAREEGREPARLPQRRQEPRVAAGQARGQRQVPSVGVGRQRAQQIGPRQRVDHRGREARRAKRLEQGLQRGAGLAAAGRTLRLSRAERLHRRRREAVREPPPAGEQVVQLPSLLAEVRRPLACTRRPAVRDLARLHRRARLVRPGRARRPGARAG